MVIDSTWASNPVVEAAAQAIQAAVGPRSRLECRVLVGVGADLDRALLDQLALVRALVGAVDELTILHRSPSGYVGQARANGTPVDLSVICSDAVPEHADIRLLTADGSVEVQVPNGDTAEPARLTVTDAAGAQLAPTQYESGHRATWRRLHRLLTAGPPGSDRATDLDRLEADLSTAVHTT